MSIPQGLGWDDQGVLTPNINSPITPNSPITINNPQTGNVETNDLSGWLDQLLSGTTVGAAPPAPANNIRPTQAGLAGNPLSAQPQGGRFNQMAQSMGQGQPVSPLSMSGQAMNPRFQGGGTPMSPQQPMAQPLSAAEIQRLFG